MYDHYSSVRCHGGGRRLDLVHYCSASSSITRVYRGVAAHSTWNYWTEPTVVKIPASESSTGQETEKVEWNLRPAWQRGGLCVAHVLAGCMFAGGLLGKRQLFIRSVYLASPEIPAGTKPVADVRRLIIQSAAETKDVGYDYPVKGSWLEPGQSNDEIILRSSWANLNSRFSLPLRSAEVSGTKYATVEEAREKLAEEWKQLLPLATTTQKR
ncbi:hypothetical protein CC2G_013807 [Coprinopsis cinerea AmutBmut pab1-1]|nr:hypothetical protein CC2G_013807 [Coprinopsis cinerea AmutBmut pab1-1]